MSGTENDTEKQMIDELSSVSYEPLLPVEKKLIAGSLILGAALLGILVWLSYAFFPLTPTR